MPFRLSTFDHLFISAIDGIGVCGAGKEVVSHGFDVITTLKLSALPAVVVACRRCVN
jgi:hypothetical protein